MARRAYCVGTSLISLADATLITCKISHYVRDHDELRPDCDGNGQEMVKCDIRIVFVGTMFCKSVANGPGFERGLSSRHACFAETMARTECDGQTDDRQTDDGRTRKLEGSLHNRPFGQ